MRMKIFDIINEQVDMSFWKEQDERFNPEALNQIEMQERRRAALAPTAKGGTPVFRKPVRKAEPSFKTEPETGMPTSPGYRGNVATRVKAGKLTPETGKKLIDNN